MNTNMSYREVIPSSLNPEDWIEVKINTGTQSTLQDIKTNEKAGALCYANVDPSQNRNRFIFWRTHQDVLELSEISLNVSLLRNNLRLRFTDSAVLNVSLFEEAERVTILVVTVSSLHRFVFQFKTYQEKTVGKSFAANEFQPHSIFYDANDNLNDPSTYFVIDGHETMSHNQPLVAVSYLSKSDQKAYFGIAYQSKLMLHIMNSSNNNTVSYEVKESHIMPRFLANLKGALIGRGEILEVPISLAFSCIDGEIYLLTLYRNDELRLWSAGTLQNVCTVSCIDAQKNAVTQGLQNSLLRKIDEHSFCVFLSHGTGAEFVCVSIVINTSSTNVKSINMVIQHTVPAPQMDLADFDATTSHIWALWSNAEGEFHVSSIMLGSGMAIKWVSAALEPPPDRYSLTLEQGVDPREAFCSYIFHPGRFDRNVIAKALNMFRRVNMRFDIHQLTMTVLKEHVCQAVEDEIQNEMKDFVVSDEEYLEIATRLWDRFYSCCEQYHCKFSEPIGLSVLKSLDAVCIVRKQSFALLRPCELLEHLMLIGEHTDDIAACLLPFCPNDPSAAVGFVKLMKVITQLEKLISEDIKMELDKKLYQRESPIDVVTKLMTQIIAGDEEGTILPPNSVKQMHQKLQEIPDIQGAIYLLLDILCMLDNNAVEESLDQSISSTFFKANGILFSSEYGLSVLAQTVKQIAMIRFAVCRNLLILQYILYGRCGLSNDTISTNINFLQAYYTLVWIAETPITLNAPTFFEASMQRLTRAQLFRGYLRPYLNGGSLYSHTTLLYLFLQSRGLYKGLSRLQVSNEDIEPSILAITLLQLVKLINKMLWPDTKDYVFTEWLFGTCHHIIIQDYVRILADWCEEKTHSRRFMLAVTLLDCGEVHKAISLFQQAVVGVLKDKFLFEQVLKNTPLYDQLKSIVDSNGKINEEQSKLATMHYYLKIIQLFEQHSALDCIIKLAHMAMNELQQDDPHLPMFQSIIFNNHLQLGHYEEAYHALVYNADTSRRKDCLRQLVITLFECKSLDLLMRFPYNGLQEEFENIVESRARSLSIDNNEVYNFLYAFHANKGNMRKAATVMYEQAMRLQVDGDMSTSLQKRCSSLLICINSLHLVDKRYRWIARPVIGDESVPMVVDNKEDEDKKNGQEVIVLELGDIRKELLFAEALSELSYHRKSVATWQLASAEELSYLLTNCGLFTAALRLAREHDFSMLPIFESLANACVGVTEEKGEEAWSWLQDNDLTDLPHQSKPVDMAWALLQKLIVENELNESTSIRKSVVSRLLTLNAFIPHWLYESYKLTNCRELLQIFVKHNRLLEASDLACEMIAGMLGAGSEYFDFKYPVAITNPELWFPVRTIDLLLHGLKLNGKENSEYELARLKLEEEVLLYIDAIKRTTDDKIKFAILQERENRQQEQNIR